LWREENWRTQRKKPRSKARTNNKLDPHRAPGQNQTRAARPFLLPIPCSNLLVTPSKSCSASAKQCNFINIYITHNRTCWGRGLQLPSYCNLSALCIPISTFTCSGLRNFFGQEGHCSPKSEGARMPMMSLSIVSCRRQRFQSLTDVLTSERINDFVSYVFSMH